MAITAPTAARRGARRGKVEEMNDGPREHVPLARHSATIAPCSRPATRVEAIGKMETREERCDGEKDEEENYAAEREMSGGRPKKKKAGRKLTSQKETKQRVIRG